MSQPRDAAHCEVSLGPGLALSDASEVALEDYARALTSAAGAAAVRSDAAPHVITAVRLLAPKSVPSLAQHRDIEDFARGLAAASGGPGLGWA